MENLGPLAAAFLQAEDADSRVSLAIGSVTVLKRPAPSQHDLTNALGQRLSALPRFRQKVHRTSFDLAEPRWVDDPGFDLEYHLRRTALPTPGDDASLCRFVARVMSHRLDRDRPLWECWVVEGLRDGRWAVLVKIHHCIADGVSGSELFDIICDRASAPTQLRAEQPAVRPAQPPAVARRALLAELGHAAGLPLQLARSAAGIALGTARFAAGLLIPAAPSSLSGPIGKPRRYGVARVSLSEVAEIGRAFGVTVNDVALAAMTGAFRELLLRRGEQPTAESVRSLVPMSTRSAAAHHVVDNRVSAMLPTLPVELADPVKRLGEVHSRLRALKSSNETEAGQSFVSLGRFLPFAPLAWALRLASRFPQRSVVTVTTNVPGPDHPLYLLRRPVLEIWPIMPIAVRLRTGVAILSYNGKLTFGITSDYDSSPEIPLLVDEVERGVAKLLIAARVPQQRTAAR